MHRLLLRVGLALFAAAPALAQLTLESALERAQNAPAIVAARMRIDEIRARASTAALRSNPSIELEAGPRSGATSSTDYGIAIAQDFEFPSRRRSRIDAAQAAVTQEEQRALETERAVLREVATTFVRALEARERAEVASHMTRLAEEALQIAERRYDAGDVAQLDVNLARTAVARAGAESRAASATLSVQLTQLQVLLGMAEPIAIAGSLRDPLPRQTHDPAQRADVRLLDAEIAEAEAEQRIVQSMRWPDVGFRAAHHREENDRILLGGIGFSLPLFQRGREANAIAGARLARLRAEREALLRAIDLQLRGAASTHETLLAVATEYERTVLPLIEENEQLALESYEAGQIGLADLLLVRRETLDARRAFVDQLVATRLAEVELRAQSGVSK